MSIVPRSTSNAKTLRVPVQRLGGRPIMVTGGDQERRLLPVLRTSRRADVSRVDYVACGMAGGES